MNKSNEFSSLHIPIEQPAGMRSQSKYVHFNDDDIENLALYAFDMGYTLESEISSLDNQLPLRFKIASKANPELYGWVTKVREINDDHGQEKFLYGFYRNGMYFHKYPISFNIESRVMRGVIKRQAQRNPKLVDYFRIVFGIIDLEPKQDPLDFIFSWLNACKFTKTAIA